MYNNNNGDACLVKERNTARRKRAQTGFSGAPKVHFCTIAPGTGALYQNCRLFSTGSAFKFQFECGILMPSGHKNGKPAGFADFQQNPNLLPIGGFGFVLCHAIPASIPFLWVFRHCLSSNLIDPVEIPGCHSLRDMLLWYHGWKRALFGGRRRSTPKRTLPGALRFGNGPVNPTPADGGRL